MCEIKAQSSALTPPRCPSCAQPMRLSRRTARFDGLPELATFECRSCGVFHIEAV
jgi:transposase-like protein